MSSFGTFNTGHDVTFEFVDPETGVPIPIPIKTGWEKKPLYDSVKSRPLNGPPIFEEDPAGWEGSATIDRADAAVDNFVAQREEAFYAGQTVRQLTILETIQEVDGGYTQWRYTGVAVKLDDAGSAARGKTIEMKLSWSAGRRKKVA